MKLMIASDIHGSAYYCKKMLEAYKKEEADRLLLLGDILYHGPRNDLPKDYNCKKVIALLNPLKKDVLNHLNHQYIEKHPYVDGGYYFDYLHYPLGKSPYFMCGLYYIQEPSAMSVASCLDIKENDYVLDMCGAPGGCLLYTSPSPRDTR